MNAEHERKPAKKRRPWRWSTEKKKVLDLFARGAYLSDIAILVNRNRHTVSGWTKEPEFQATLHRRIGERQTVGTMRRSYFSSKAANELMDLYLELLRKHKKAQPGSHQLELLREMEQVSVQLARIRDQYRIDQRQGATIFNYTAPPLCGKRS